jgi:PKD repeat protein
MKTKLYLFTIMLALVATACTPSEDPVIANFEVEVSGDSPNATVTLENKSSNDAESYLWIFSEGADKDSLTIKNPVINVDKAGEFTIKLKATRGSESNIFTKKVQIAGKNGVKVFKDIELAMDGTSTEYGRCFSTVTGKIYKDSEVNSANGSLIDLLFINFGNTMYFFDNPKDEANDGLQIPQGQNVVVDNYPNYPDDVFTIEQFDAITDSESLESLTITNGQNSFGNSSVPCIILFQNAAGFKGAIKAKVMNSDRMMFDITVQKYL